MSSYNTVPQYGVCVPLEMRRGPGSEIAGARAYANACAGEREPAQVGARAHAREQTTAPLERAERTKHYHQIAYFTL